MGLDTRAAIGVAAPDPAVVPPWTLRYLTSPWVAALGLGAIAAAVMSSVDSSIVSAASFRTLATVSGLTTILVVSRLTARRCPPVPLASFRAVGVPAPDAAIATN